MKVITIIFLLLVFMFPIESTFGQNVPKFWIRSLEGKRFDSRKEKSPYVISFFFVNCIPCIKEIPELYKFMNTIFPNVPLLFIDPIKEDSKKEKSPYVISFFFVHCPPCIKEIPLLHKFMSKIFHMFLFFL